MRALKYLFISLIIGFLILFPGFIYLYELKKALLASAIGAFLYSIFSFGFMFRSLKMVTLEINARNKDPQLGLAWYEQEILGQIRSMRFRQYLKTESVIKFRPFGIYQVLESPVEVRVSAYDITIKCSKMMKRIISDLVEIKESDL